VLWTCDLWLWWSEVEMGRSIIVAFTNLTSHFYLFCYFLYIRNCSLTHSLTHSHSLYIAIFLLETFKALNGLLCADVPLRNYSLTLPVVWCDFCPLSWFRGHDRENQRTLCNFSVWMDTDVGLCCTRKLCCGRETARCHCKLWCVPKFTAASSGSPCNSMALVVSVVAFRILTDEIWCWFTVFTLV